MTRPHVAACSLLALLVVAPPAGAEIPIVDSDDARFSLAGYVRSLSGYQRLGYDVPEGVPDDLGLNSTVVRFEWGLNVGEHVTLDIHNRFFWQLTSEQLSTGGGLLGVGVSQAPGRHVDLESTIIDDDGLLMTHDVDRLVLRLYMDWGDLSLGRQAITWGNGVLFPVADLWTTFSPFELDTSEKRGVDSVRLITAPGDNWELELVFADKGEVEDLSGGVRATFYLPVADVYVAAAKIWEELLVFAGIQADLEHFSLRAEFVQPYDIDDGDVLIPRATAGFDYLGVDWLVSVEVHVNGLGAGTVPEGYIAELSSEELGRGETYLLGRYYLGALASYQLTELVSLGTSVITNLRDPSALFTATARYDVAANADITLGAFVPAGSAPELGLVPALGSEFGTYGQLYYAQLSAYW